MRQEEIPKSFPADVRKGRRDFIHGWEERTRDKGDARLFFEIFEDRLKKLGIEIKKSKVLEIGSGQNVFLDYLQKQGIDAVGIDSRPRGNTEDLPLIVGRIEQLPFPNETFDVVLSNAVFDVNTYDQNHRLMIGEISRVLKHGGVYAAIERHIEESAGNLLIPDSDQEKMVNIFRKS